MMEEDKQKLLSQDKRVKEVISILLTKKFLESPHEMLQKHSSTHLFTELETQSLEQFLEEVRERAEVQGKNFLKELQDSLILLQELSKSIEGVGISLVLTEEGFIFVRSTQH